jgi:hypothetical protein
MNSSIKKWKIEQRKEIDVRRSTTTRTSAQNKRSYSIVVLLF